MGRGRAPWQDGRRAWTRLNGWHNDDAHAVPGHDDDGDAALKALADVDLVRRLIERAELVAVKTARKHGKTWAEIGTQLGMSRQAAWDRWREFDSGAGEHE